MHAQSDPKPTPFTLFDTPGVRHVARVHTSDGARYASVEGDRLALLDRAPWEGGTPSGSSLARAEALLLVPCSPSKIVCVGVNYAEHAKESVSLTALPDEPVLFFKPPSALIAHGEAIRAPQGVGRVDHEAELAVVIGKRLFGGGEREARAAIAGVTALNDVSARVLQKKDGQFARAKGFDTFCPVGPAIALGLDPSDLAVRARVNGAVRQDGRSKDLAVGAVALVAFIAGVMTLEPGDIVSTGTPAGVGPIEPGDVVEIEIEGVGILVNPVVARA